MPSATALAVEYDLVSGAVKRTEAETTAAAAQQAHVDFAAD